MNTEQAISIEKSPTFQVAQALQKVLVVLCLMALTIVLTACGTSAPKLPEPQETSFTATGSIEVTADTNEVVVVVTHTEDKVLGLAILSSGAEETFHPVSSPVVHMVITRKFTFRFDHVPDKKEVEAASAWVVKEVMDDECDGPCESVVMFATQQ